MKKAGGSCRRRPPAADRRRDHRARLERQVAGAERALCGDQGAARRLLHDRRADLDAALSWASRCPGAQFGAIEVARSGRDERMPMAQATMRAKPRRRWRAGATASWSPSAARTRDVAGAEDALSDAFAAALAIGRPRACPRHPEAWLMTRRGESRSMPRAGAAGSEASDICASWPRSWRPVAAATAAGPDERLAADVRLRASRDRQRHPRAADPADHPGLRRRNHRLGLPRLARDHGPAPVARQEQDPEAGIPVPGAGARGPARAARCGARGHLRRVRRRLVRSGRHRARRRNLAEEGIWLGRLVASLLPDEPEALGLWR